MKIEVIMGSPRKKDSYNICNEISQHIKRHDKDIIVDYIFLSEYNIQDCKGCCKCFQESENICPCRKDELKCIKERLSFADGIIMASPVYAYQVTGQMKRFIDRMSYQFHRQEFCGKPTLIVVTTDGGGSKHVYKYLKMTLSGWGMDVVGNIQIISPMYFKDRIPKSTFGYDEYYNKSKNKKIKSLTKSFYTRLSATEKRTPTYYDIFMFNCLRSKTYTSFVDYKYWKEKGWLSSNYFYKVKLNPFKKIFGYILKKLIHIVGLKYIKKASDE